MLLSELEKAVLLSVSYSQVFSFPLSLEDIYLRLISKKLISKEEIKKIISVLLDKKLLHLEKNHFFISSKKKVDRVNENINSLELISQREKNAKYSKQKLVEAYKFVNKAKYIPFIKAIAVTGSVSVSNAKENDDVDWLIITSPNTLWLTRPLVILLSSFYGKRRQRDGHHRDNSWCFNMFLTENSLQVSGQKRSLYTAYEVCQTLFVYDQNEVEKKFLEENSWVKNYLANFYSFGLANLIKTNKVNKKKSNKSDFILSFFDNLAFILQYLYMKKRMTREVVKKDRAFFHPRDTKSEIYNKWKNILTSLN